MSKPESCRVAIMGSAGNGKTGEDIMWRLSVETEHISLDVLLSP